jgi:hypothetical protein
MPIQLTTPKMAAEDPNGVTEYAQVELKQPTIDPDNKRISFGIQYGNTISGAWVPAMPLGQEIRPQIYTIYNHPEDLEADPPVAADPQYDILIASTLSTTVGEPAFELVANAVYQWLLSNGYYDGIIV